MVAVMVGRAERRTVGLAIAVALGSGVTLGAAVGLGEGTLAGVFVGSGVGGAAGDGAAASIVPVGCAPGPVVAVDGGATRVTVEVQLARMSDNSTLRTVSL
jgi:hypothetical protein